MSDRPPEALLWDFLRGATATKALAVVVDLGVPDALADGPRPVADLAQELAAHPDTLRRILRALASDGIFVEQPAGTFGHTDASLRLREPGWSEFAHLFGGFFYEAIEDLDASGSEATFARRFGADFWPWLGSHSDERAIFDRAMAGGKERSAERLAALDWRGDETVVDVGGGNGALLTGLLRRCTGLRGIVFDLPETERDESALGERCTFVEGDFFESVPAGDAYILSGVLHDWSDEDATRILRTIRAAAPPQARLLIVESVVPEDNEPNGAKWLDLLMLVLAGGRERTEAGWRALIGGAGFEVDEIEEGLIQATCR
jgi:hypothetical protein